ncbi:MAG: CCA tRNA nucleotidyltransferase [Candidatus Omnitrophica bacterium]|nr:CCA tRNA nucleotidyltransferase [Candidatus Omnitrophota bacterium]
MNQSERIATQIVKRLRDKGFQALFAGGCVRDRLMGNPPKDIDIATDALPEQIQTLFPRTVPVGIQFGVILVVEEGAAFQVATFRSDGKYLDGRHPVEVNYSKTPPEDASRRDFTINGLYFDPIAQKILDFVGGREDIQKKIVRTIGDPKARFQEDKLRLLRAVRFASTLEFEIEKETFAALRALADKIAEVSAERVREELVKLLSGGHAERGLALLDETGLLPKILPEVSRMKGVEQPPQFHPEGDVFIHTKMMMGMLDHLPERPAVLAMSTLLHDVGKPPTFRQAPDRIRFDNHDRVGARMARDICHRLRFSNDEIDQIAEGVEKHMDFKNAPKMREATLKRFMRRPTFEWEIEMHRMDCLASHRDLTVYQFLTQKYAEFKKEVPKPKLWVSGDDLIQMGFAPGPRFKEILSAVEDEQLEHHLNSKEETMQWVLKKFPI